MKILGFGFYCLIQFFGHKIVWYSLKESQNSERWKELTAKLVIRMKSCGTLCLGRPIKLVGMEKVIGKINVT